MTTETQTLPAGTYMGWYEPNAKSPVSVRLMAGLGRFQRKYGAEASVVLANPAQVEETIAALAELGVRVEGDAMVALNTWYLGREERG